MSINAARTLVRRRMLPSEPSQMTRAQLDNSPAGVTVDNPSVGAVMFPSQGSNGGVRSRSRNYPSPVLVHALEVDLVDG